MVTRLQVYGRKMYFEQEDLIAAIVEKLFSTEEAKRIAIPVPPTMNEWFQVFPKEIDPYLFERKREDVNQEKTRQLILEAFEELKKNPKIYAKPFQTFIPEKYKDWDGEMETVPYIHRAAAPSTTTEWIPNQIKMKDFIEKYEQRVHFEYYNSNPIFMLNWIGQALEWAQRISNGESWENLCNYDRNDGYYEKLIIWKNEAEYALIGSTYNSTKVKNIFKCEDNELISPTAYAQPAFARFL